ncbi:Molybdopterin cofactor biosynthesis C domain-containing protein [Geranomyces variabilis]|nr:Molybdopterin cofactor biosynthesis C domain-containing protein [Geranomyces variabilis]KAJ3133382.1 Cyclic pyranopterin monophosphate synthase, mitochondrial [Geranomyces variabilis]
MHLPTPQVRPQASLPAQHLTHCQQRPPSSPRFYSTAPALTHTDSTGRAKMVDVSTKRVTARSATAVGRILLSPLAFKLVSENAIAKGDVLTVAQIAGIGAAKQTGMLIPLCHPLPLSGIKVELSLDKKARAVDVEATVSCSGQTGVEMEALVAVSVACCTVFDMCKAVDKGMRITDVRVVRKSGGQSGDWTAE